MIRQEIYIPKYDWRVRIYYAVTTYWRERILSDLRDIGCRGLQLERADCSLSSGDLNTGLTYSDFEGRRTVMVISRASSASEFLNSWIHEMLHLCRHVCRAFGIDPYGEEAAYLSGDVGQKMFRVARRFVCDCCRGKME